MTAAAQDPADLPIVDTLRDLPVVDARYGRVRYIADDDPIGKSISEYGEWAQVELEFLSAFIGLGSVCVDIGANIGTHALAFSKRVGPRGSVIAFEPQRYVADILKTNLVNNDCGNAKVHQLGIGRNAGEMLVPLIDYSAHMNAGGVALVSAAEDANGARVAIASLDSFALAACDLVKIDAEGMEGDVILGMTDTLQRLRPIVFAECNSVDVGAAILRSFAWPDYDAFLVRTAAFNPHNFRQNPSNFFGVSMESGLLLAPKEARHLIPLSEPLAEVIPVSTLNELAEALLATPRYGDVSRHDRNSRWLRAELEGAHQEIATVKAKARAHAGQRVAAEAREAELKKEFEAAQVREAELNRKLEAAEERTEAIPRLEFRAASLAKQLMRAEEQIAKMAALEAELNQSVTQLEAAIIALHSSTSWRITAPLRRLMTLLRAARLGVPS